MEFVCQVKAIKADIAKKEITLSFTVDMNDENMESADDLSFYVDKEHGEVELKILPRMVNFLKHAKEVTLTEK